MPDPSKPDAILVMRGVIPGDRIERHREYRRRFGAAMDPILEQDVESPAAHLLTPDAPQLVLHPAGHPEAGSPRYEWVDVAPGVRYGWKRPGVAPTADPPLLDPAAIRAQLVARGVLAAAPEPAPAPEPQPEPAPTG